jgi:hypothetical protein
MTLMELIVVVMLSSLILGMVMSVTISFAKHDSRNHARQVRTEEIRQVSLWLSDALAHAAPANGTVDGQVFAVAMPQKAVFTSALGAVSGGMKLVSRVAIVMGETCWSGVADAGTLRLCVQHPVLDGAGNQSYCAHGSAGCSDDLFEESVVARHVKDQPLFYYSLAQDIDQTAPTTSVDDPARLGSIAAVELRITVKGEPGSAHEDVEATVVKRHAVRGWSRL